MCDHWVLAGTPKPKTGAVMPEPGGPGGPLAPPQYLGDQLTLFEPGRAYYPHLLLKAPPNFFTFRHHCYVAGKQNCYQLTNLP